MRYIKMKKGIIEFDDNFHIIKNNELYSLFFINDIPVSEKIGDIISQADTIEELCDGFYIDFISDLEKYKNFVNEERIFNSFRFDEFKEQFKAYRELEESIYNHCEGYGFIKTSKGLIYVAKMNEEGELELL